jgi:MFS family permease
MNRHKSPIKNEKKVSRTEKTDLNNSNNNLTKEQTIETKKNSIKDACAYNVMYGFGEQYVTPYALKLGATNSEIGILSSVPSFIGALFQVFGAKLSEKFQSRKKVVLLFVLLQALMLLPLFIVPLLTKNMLLLTLIFSIYLICSNAASPAWNSWIGEVVSDNERAEYFSKRNKTSLVFLLISVLIAGIILNYFTNINIWIGFGILFIVAFFGRIISWYYLTKQYEPKYVLKEEEAFSFKDFLKRMPETNFGNFVMFRSLMAFAVMIASPFFAVYMLKDLNFTYIQYTTIVLVPMIAKILTVTYWGKYSKKIGTRNIMIVSAFLIALIPVLWFIVGYFFFNQTWIVFLLIPAEIVSGFAWAGFELTTFNYVLETVKPAKRARCVAYFNIVFGTAVLVGGLAGSWLVGHLPESYRGISLILMVFLISAVARFLVPLLFLKKLKEVKIQKDIDDGKLFIDLVISKPLHSAMHQTTQVMFLAEDKVAKLGNRAHNIVKKPFRPVIRGIISGLDKGLTRIEPIRKAIEPKSLKEMKKNDYKHLINYNYDKQFMNHPELIKKIRKIKKPKAKK